MSKLSEAEAQAILSFLGYGNPAGPLWFIGLEEGLGNMDDAEAMANLHARGEFQEIMDLGRAHLALVEAGRPYDLANRTSFNQVWLWMAKFARAFQGASDWENLGAANDYIRKHLGRSSGDTFMTYASPIPEKGLHTRQWTEFLAESGASTTELSLQRRRRIASLIHHNHPSIVICHGATYADLYKAVLPQLDWRPVTGTDRIQWAHDQRGSRYFLTPFFGTGQMSWQRARALVAALRQDAVRGTSSRHAVVPPGQLKSLETSSQASAAARINRFIQHSDFSNPQETVALLDFLVGLGLTDDAFWQLHHKKLKGKHETIQGFRSYCLKTRSFDPGGNNWRVHDRLVLVLRAYLANPSSDFSLLAQRAFRDIPAV